MKISSFNPHIITNRSQEYISLFKELGFECRHKKTTEVEEGIITSVRMKDSGGFHVDVTEIEEGTSDRNAIRMNVDNFDEAYGFLKSKGFKNAYGERILDTGSSIAALMVSPSGFAIVLDHHIKRKKTEQFMEV
ncbi:hypothetical protein UYO_1946 [Lachnospiraceae bacterium JC7]|nr:hypothetical protein UYO_1946 [Lachnospiraceae bacterium JC7]